MSQQPRFLKLLRLISLLSSGRKYNTQKLSEFLEVHPRSIYRAFGTLEEAGFLLEKRFWSKINISFMENLGVSTLRPSVFSKEIWNTSRTNGQGLSREHPYHETGNFLLKLFQESELPAIKEVLIKARWQPVGRKKCKTSSWWK